MKHQTTLTWIGRKVEEPLGWAEPPGTERWNESINKSSSTCGSPSRAQNCRPPEWDPVQFRRSCHNFLCLQGTQRRWPQNIGGKLGRGDLAETENELAREDLAQQLASFYACSLCNQMCIKICCDKLSHAADSKCVQGGGGHGDK